MKILIVDDTAAMREILEATLQLLGYTDIQQFASGLAAVEFLEAQSEPETIGLILMDIQMPGLNGIETCKKVKSMEAYQDLPIIMVTSLTDDQPLEEAFAAGASDYLTKPVNKVQLKARMASVLSLKKEMDLRRAREVELRSANEVLQHLSSTDGLTNIANRSSFDSFLQMEWDRGLRSATPLTLVLLDVDYFKKFNDTYGHQEGDDCLIQIAGVLQSHVRRAGDLAARYGGEEFALILANTEAEGGQKIAESIREAIIKLNIKTEASEVAPHVTASFGVARMMPGADHTPADLIKQADEALYQAKHAGRNQVKIHAG